MNNRYDAACFGEVLWDLLPSGAKPGGAPMNVAYHLQKLGLQTALISKVGNDEKGTELLSLLQQNGVTTDFVQKDEAHVTGVVNATVHQSNEVTYEIVQPVAWDFIQLEEDLTKVVSGAPFFVFGSLAARCATTAKTLSALLEMAQTKVLDINLRPPHFTQTKVEDLLRSADFLKLNEHELPLLSSWYGNAKTDREQVQLLQDRFCLSTVLVTKGGDGAMVCVDGKIFAHPGYRVTVADTVGSGDAFLAAYLSKTKEGATIEERLEFANALGAFMASKNGACPVYEVSEVAQAFLPRKQ